MDKLFIEYMLIDQMKLYKKESDFYPILNKSLEIHVIHLYTYDF